MKKQVKIWIAAIVAVVLLVGCGLWFYWEAQRPIMKYLPEGDWQSVSFSARGRLSVREWVVDEEAVVEIEEILSNTKLNRGSAFIPELEEAWYTVKINDVSIIVVKDGRLLLMERDGTGEEKFTYFEGGEDLFQRLRALSGELDIFITS
jgi:hypothetical protein